jgi:hypothetical protein
VWTVRGLTQLPIGQFDSERSFSPKRLPEAQFRAKPPFLFYYLMRNYWENFGFLIRIATALRRLFATTL